MELTEFCKKCGGKCCLHPHLQPHEYQKFIDTFGEETVQKMNPTPSPMAGWMIITNCCAVTPTGCSFSYEDRPLVCKIYPFETTRTEKGWKLTLDVATCPYWMVFGHLYDEAAEALIKYLVQK